MSSSPLDARVTERPNAAGYAIAFAIAVSVMAPPEVRGWGMAVLAVPLGLAIVATARFAAATPGSRWVWGMLPVVLAAMKASVAPGETVEPVAVLVLAILAGMAAAGVSVPAVRLAQAFGILVVFVATRALYEAGWGLATAAESLRAANASGQAEAVLNRLEQGRPYAGFLTPAALGCFFAMTVPAVAAWAFGRTGVARVLGLSAAAAGAAGLAATRSVGAMAALACALGLSAVRGRVALRWLAAASGAIAIAVLAAGLVRPDAVFAPAREDSPWRLRAGNVRIALEMAREHPLAGVGPGGYAEVFPAHRRAGDNESRHAHDLPAELVAEWGVPAGLAMSACFFWLFLAPVLRPHADPRTFASGLAVGVAAFALHNLVDFTAFLPSLLIFAAVCRGLLASDRREAVAPLPFRAAWIALAAAAAVVAGASGLARDALFDARQAASAGDHARALGNATRAGRLAPWDADPPLIAASARMASGGDAAIALREADRAVRNAPGRASARAARAMIRSALHDAPGAYADSVEAARLYPLKAGYREQRDALAAALAKAAEAAPR